MFWKRDLGFIDITGRGQAASAPPRVGGNFERLLVYFGIILPLLALTFENQFHLCAYYFFDPFPTASHSLLFAMIPFANLLAWMSLCRNNNNQLGLTLFANGMAFGVSVLYSLMFMPIMPQAAQLIFLLGLGLLAFSPSIALLILWRAGKHVEKAADKAGTYFNSHQVHHAGHFLILATVLAVELPSTYTRVALDLASQPRSREQGLNMLRSFGNQEVMLRACYERSGRATDVIGSLYESHHPLGVEEMRRIFYQATGRTFNSFPIPEAARATMQHRGALSYDGIDNGADDEFDADPDIAGEMVSGVSRGLSVSKSELSADIDSNACVSQLNWFLDFKNKSKFDREVRTRVRLPHGAAINQASLIVNGKEYECQITLKETARQIYIEAVKSKRNPLLVSHCGEDTVLVQCFPVPPGQKLQLHLGMAAPLQLDQKQNAALTLPQFEERNFQINVPHDLKLSANNEISAAWGSWKSEHNSSGKYLLSGKIDSDKLATGGGTVLLKRAADKNSFFCNDNFDGTAMGMKLSMDSKEASNFTVEKLDEIKRNCPSNLFVVLDCSQGMSQDFKAITQAFKTIPAKVKNVMVSCVVDSGVSKLRLRKDGKDQDKEYERLESIKCIGGQIDTQALLDAMSCSSHKSPVLWIHPAQPLSNYWQDLLSSQLSETRVKYRILPGMHNSSAEQQGRIFDLQIQSGPNQILEGVNSTRIEKLPRFSDPASDLKLLFQEWEKPGLLKKFVYADSRTPDDLPSAFLQKANRQGPATGAAVGAPVAARMAAAAGVPEAEFVLAPTGVLENSNETSAAACSIGDQVSEEYPESSDSCEASPWACMPKPAFAFNQCGRYIRPQLSKEGISTMPQLAQLWANQKINEYCRQGDEQSALHLAANYHLVTPVSSAVLVDTVSELERLSCPPPEPCSQNSPRAQLMAFLQNLSIFTGEYHSSIVQQLNRLNYDSNGPGYRSYAFPDSPVCKDAVCALPPPARQAYGGAFPKEYCGQGGMLTESEGGAGGQDYGEAGGAGAAIDGFETNSASVVEMPVRGTLLRSRAMRRAASSGSRQLAEKAPLPMIFPQSERSAQSFKREESAADEISLSEPEPQKPKSWSTGRLSNSRNEYLEKKAKSYSMQQNNIGGITPQIAARDAANTPACPPACGPVPANTNSGETPAPYGAPASGTLRNKEQSYRESCRYAGPATCSIERPRADDNANIDADKIQQWSTTLPPSNVGSETIIGVNTASSDCCSTESPECMSIDGELDFAAFLQKYWFGVMGMFFMVFALVRVSLQRLGLEKPNDSESLFSMKPKAKV